MSELLYVGHRQAFLDLWRLTFFFTRTEFAGQVAYRMVSPLRRKMERSWAGLITTNTPLVSRVSDELHIAQIMMHKCGNSPWVQPEEVAEQG